MNEVKKCVRSIAVCFILLAINIVFYADIIPSVFPVANISSIYLLFVSAGLILRYYLRVSGSAKQKNMMLMLSGMIFLLVLLRCVKYSAFGSEFILGRYTWYLYYVPMLLIPTFLFFVSQYVFAKDEKQINKNWRLVFVISLVLILLVLTNDFHQWVFRFNDNFENWDSEYSYGILFYIVIVWQYILYTASVAVLIAKCSIAKIKTKSFVIFIPFVMGIGILILLATDKIPDIMVICFIVAGVLECCMHLGLIPTNEDYNGLMKITSVPVQITDSMGNVIYKSDSADVLTKEQFDSSDNSRIAEHTILNKMAVHGGYGFYQNDVTELDRLNEELEETKAALSEESELIRLQNELKEKQARIEHRSAVYDVIANRTQRQSLAISRIADQALNSDDKSFQDKCRKHITLLGAYIKRYANLMILASENKNIAVGELGISVAEVLRYLNAYGVPAELINTAGGTIPSDDALILFGIFEELIENNLSGISGSFVNISEDNDKLYFKIALESIVTADFSSAVVKYEFTKEDNTGYFCFTVPKGGEVE